MATSAMIASSWLSVSRGDAPLILSMPHTGTNLGALSDRFISLWRARKDTDWWVERLYDFASDLRATTVRTNLSRSIIDVNRDPSGASLYPGQVTTGLCPLTTFDGESLYRSGDEPSVVEITERRAMFYDPYHIALSAEIERLRKSHPRIVVYDCHSIRSNIPHLFEGALPNFNIGTNSGASCDPALTAAVEVVCKGTPFSAVVNGRFKGGYITRSSGCPDQGVHAIQMELACRGYLREISGPVTEDEWPVNYDEDFAAPMSAALKDILKACLDFATNPDSKDSP